MDRKGKRRKSADGNQDTGSCFSVIFPLYLSEQFCKTCHTVGGISTVYFSTSFFFLLSLLLFCTPLLV